MWDATAFAGQWGMPRVSLVPVLSMLFAVVSSILESISDYYACARLAGAPPPPAHAINRAVLAEGTGSLIAGLLGTGNSTTSYSENVAAITITQVNSEFGFYRSAVFKTGQF